MTKSEFNQQAQTIMERGKEVVAEGKQRHLVLRKQDGTQLFETNLTVAAGATVGLLVMGFLTWPVVLIAAIAAYVTRVKLELRRD
jgi:hypothetical protein